MSWEFLDLRGHVMLRQSLLCGVIVLLQPYVLHADSPEAVDAGRDLEIVEIEGDMLIDKALTVENRHMRFAAM